MRSRITAAILGVAFIAVISLAYVSSFNHAPSLAASTSTGPLTSSPPRASNNSGLAPTIEDLIAGKFPTASDKRGTGGMTVTVRNLHVLYVRTESDGDWHVGVTDGTVPVFITEITPSYQQSEGEPPVGSNIDETGIAYCDTVHEAESWHGDTCWEIHPVTAWQLSSSGAVSSTITKGTVAQGLDATISFGQDPISRGSTQTITVQVRDSDGLVSGATVSVEVDYASGATVHNFTCATSTDGACSISWEIGPTSTPGIFTVIVDVGGIEFNSSFSVTE